MTAAVIDEAAIAASVWQRATSGLGAPAPTKMPTLCSGAELLRADLPEPRALIHPLIAEGDQMMLYGYRGSGKTWLALALACALASGGRFLVWKAMRPARVMIADGEMRASRMKKRLQLVIAGIDRDIADDDLQILTRDMQPRDAHWPDLGRHWSHGCGRCDDCNHRRGCRTRTGNRHPSGRRCRIGRSRRRSRWR